MNKFIIGDLVKSIYTGKIGIVTGVAPNLDYYYVLFSDKTYTAHTQNLEPLEKL